MSILIRVRHREEARTNAKIIHETAESTSPTISFHPTTDDHHQRLRGIPAIGRNVTGAIPGTNPIRILR